jgi:bifunctional non-homologous end joining protein LigD
VTSRRQIQITHPEKILFPNAGLTKQDLTTYYQVIAAALIPFLKNRPLMFQRFPQGINHPGFYQKDTGPSFPDWIDQVMVARENQKPIMQAVIQTKAALLYSVNLNTITFHPWLSTTRNLHNPDKLIFDLDPPANGFKTAVKGALLLRELLERKYGLTCFVMTTGSSGLHVTIPIKATEPFDVVRPFAFAIGEELARQYPEEFTTGQRIENRGNRLYIDYMRNSYALTAVAPYTVRALPDAPVAATLFWEELQDKDLQAQQYNILTMPARLRETGNPWKDFRKHAKNLKQAITLQKAEAVKR